MDRALMDGSGKDPVCIPEPSSGTDALEEQGSAAVTNTGHPPLVTRHWSPATSAAPAGRSELGCRGAAGEAAAMPVSMATSALGARWR